MSSCHSWRRFRDGRQYAPVFSDHAEAVSRLNAPFSLMDVKAVFVSCVRDWEFEGWLEPGLVHKVKGHLDLGMLCDPLLAGMPSVMRGQIALPTTPRVSPAMWAGELRFVMTLPIWQGQSLGHFHVGTRVFVDDIIVELFHAGPYIAAVGAVETASVVTSELEAKGLPLAVRKTAVNGSTAEVAEAVEKLAPSPGQKICW